MRPIIGITANYSLDGSSQCREGIGTPGQEWQLLADDYITAVTRAGGLPLILPLIRGEDREALWAELLDQVDGVLFSGGNDVDPLLFGEISTGKTGGLIPARDEQELWMANYLLKHTRKPILGICRGIQILNVALGGTLIQHVPDAGVSPHTLLMYPRERASHAVRVQPDSLLARILGTESLGVNSFHHMAVKTCAPALRVTARADDGITEAVELLDNPEGRFFLAVQWHPEMMAWADGQAQALLDAFVASCRETPSRPDFRLDPLI